MVTYLVGSCHLDPKGPERLRKFLGFVRPSSICHESSEETAKILLEERSKKIGNFLRMINLSDPALKLSAMLEYAYGYEIWVPYQHQQEDNPAVTIYPLEKHKAIEDALESLADLLEKADLDENHSTWTTSLNEGLINGNLKMFQKSIDAAYFDSQAVEDLQKSLEDNDYILKERDGPMEQKIREIMAKDLGGTTVAVCGVGHIFGDYNNLYERLKDLSVCRIRLPEVEKF